MKQLFIFFLFLGVSQLSFSQSACDNFEKAKQIDASADQKDHGTLKQIVLYWSKRCACESGSITGGTWDYTVEVANRVYDNYKDGSVTMGYTGPSFPVPDKRITVNDCNSDNNFNINPDISDCRPNTFTNSEDPQQYGNAFMLARCECENGVPNEERAKQLEATMKINFQNAKTYYGNTLGMPQLMKWTECPIIQFGGIQSNESAKKSAPTLVYTGRESNLQRLKDDYIKEFSSGGTFSAYVKGENIKRTGIALARQLSEGLEGISASIASSDPKGILNEFNEKIRQIEQLEANFNNQNNQYSFDAGRELGESINNKDWEAGIHQLGGIINAGLDAREAKKELEAKKQALYEARLNQMSQVYWKAVDFNKHQRAQYLKAAAYAKDQSDEEYNLGFVQNLDCFLNKMENNFSSYNTNWLVNDCPVPTKENALVLNHNGQNEVKKYVSIAERKFDLFKETGEEEFRNAAITYISAAIDKKPTSEYFLLLAKYYKNYSNLLEYTALLSADTYSKTPNTKIKRRVDNLKRRVQSEINYALDYNDVDYLNGFLDAGLMDVVFIDGHNVLAYAINLDKTDAVLSILNYKNKDVPAKKVKENIENVLMSSVISNSHNTLKTLINNGVETDVFVKGKSPISVANELFCVESFQVLVNNSSNKAEYQQKYKDSPIHVLIKGASNPNEGGKLLDNHQPDDIKSVINHVVNRKEVKTEYLSVLYHSDVARSTIQSSVELQDLLLEALATELENNIAKSKSATIVSSKLINFFEVPMLSDIRSHIRTNEMEQLGPIERPLSHDEEIDILVEYVLDDIRTLEALEQTDISKQAIEESKSQLERFEEMRNSSSESNRKLVLKELFQRFSQYGNEDENKQEYGEYYAENFMRETPYTTKELVEIDLAHQKEYLESIKKPDYIYADNVQFKSFMYNETAKKIGVYEDYLNSGKKMDDIYVNLLYQYVPLVLLEKDMPLDAKCVKTVFGIDVKNSGDVIDMNLIYYAWHKNDPLLFKALDEQFDLNKVRIGDKSLLEVIIENGSLSRIYEHAMWIDNGYYGDGGPKGYYQHNIELFHSAGNVSAKDKDRMLLEYQGKIIQWENRSLFYSGDFDFSATSSNGTNMFDYYISHFPTEGIDYTSKYHLRSSKVAEMGEIIDKYELDLSTFRIKNGGTILHWFVDFVKEESCIDGYLVNTNLIKIADRLKQTSIDKSIKNNQGQTAYQYLIENKKEICPKTIITVKKLSSASTIGNPIYWDAPKKISVSKYIQGVVK